MKTAHVFLECCLGTESFATLLAYEPNFLKAIEYFKQYGVIVVRTNCQETIFSRESKYESCLQDSLPVPRGVFSSLQNLLPFHMAVQYEDVWLPSCITLEIDILSFIYRILQLTQSRRDDSMGVNSSDCINNLVIQI